MSKKNFNVHCNITQYVEKVNPELHDLLEGTCCNMTLNSLRNRDGITFLMPDKKIITEIKSLAYSNKVEDVDAAVYKLQSLIVFDVFQNADDWKKFKDIPDANGNMVVINPETSTGTKVTFTNGATATFNTDFQVTARNREKKVKYAIWNFTGPLFDPKDAKPSKITGKRSNLRTRGSATKTGSYELTDEDLRSARWSIVLALENAQLVQCQSRRDFTVLHKSAMALCKYIKAQESAVYAKILPLITHTDLDAYILIEPHSRNNNHLVPDELINGWWSSNEKIDYAGYCAEIKADQASAEDSTIVDNICQNKPSNPQKLQDFVNYTNKTYKEMEASNSFMGAKLFPDATYRYLSSNPGMKQCYDELYFLTIMHCCNLDKKSADECVKTYNQLFGVYATNLRVCGHPISDKADDALLMKFVNSNCFMYLGHHRCKSDADSVPMVTNSPMDITPMDISAMIDLRHNRIIADSKQRDFMDMVNKLKTAKLSDEERNQLKNLLN